MLQRFDALTDDDKAAIRQMCKDAGLPATFNKRCANCYQDALMLLKMHFHVSAANADKVTPSGNFVFHDGVKRVVWWHNGHYKELSAHSDDATIERYMAMHPTQTQFSRVEKAGNGIEIAEQGGGGAVIQGEQENGLEGQKNEN